jgi:membrane protease YdiL (CAAX protease family)
VKQPGRLAGWLVLVGSLSLLNYAARATSGKPDRNVLYHYGAAVQSFIWFAFVLGIVVALAGPGDRRAQLALRRPRSIFRAVVLGLGSIAAVYALSALLDPLLHPGREQGLTPTHWEPAHAGAYAANFFVIAVVAPIVEELTFRGLGYNLILPYSPTLALFGTSVGWGLAHGLVQALPILVAFGVLLAFLRSRTDSVYPGMVVHGLFNTIALIVAVA